MLRNPISPDRWLPLLLVAFGGKLLLLLFVLWEHHIPLNGPWYFTGGDTTGYTEPIDSLLNGSGYQPDSRMPGYGVPYLLLRLIMSMHAALQCLVVIQALASAVGVVLLSKLAYELTDDLRVFRWTYGLALVAIFSSFYDRLILTESFSTLAMVLSTWAIVRHGKNGGRGWLTLAGTAIAWLIFMKPVFLPMLVIVPAAFAMWDRFQWRRVLPKALLLLAPFLVADGAWSLRNATLYGVFRPLSDGVVSPAIREGIKYPVITLIREYGGNFVWWDPTSDIRWFNVSEADPPPEQAFEGPFPLPGYVLTEKCPMDTLARIASVIHGYNTSADGTAKKRALVDVRASCERCAKSFRNDRPFHYQITARLRMLRIFLITPGNAELMSGPFGELNTLEKCVKLLYSLIFLCTVVPGVIWGLRSFFHPRSSIGLRMVSALMLYGVFIFPFAMRMTETRYLTTVYPFAVMFTVLMGTSAWDRFRKRSVAN